MDIRTEDKIRQLNVERTWATELIAAVGQFLDKAQGANCPKLKASCDQLITCGLAMITHHTKSIADLRASEVATQTADAKRCTVRDIAKMKPIGQNRVASDAARGGNGGYAARGGNASDAARGGNGGYAARGGNGGYAARGGNASDAARGGNGNYAARGGNGDYAARGGNGGYAARGGRAE